MSTSNSKEVLAAGRIVAQGAARSRKKLPACGRKRSSCACIIFGLYCSVRCTNKLRQSKPDIVKYLLNKTSVGNKEWVCQTCSRYLMKNKVPPCSIANGMAFPVKPDFFDLNELECRLLAPRIAFQKLMQAPRGRQLKIHGNIVNVPADVTHTVSILPRLQNQTATIKVNLKQMLKYKSSALSPLQNKSGIFWLFPEFFLEYDRKCF